MFQYYPCSGYVEFLGMTMQENTFALLLLTITALFGTLVLIFLFNSYEKYKKYKENEDE
jgi:phage terminase large subunit-like protein